MLCCFFFMIPFHKDPNQNYEMCGGVETNQREHFTSSPISLALMHRFQFFNCVGFSTWDNNWLSKVSTSCHGGKASCFQLKVHVNFSPTYWVPSTPSDISGLTVAALDCSYLTRVAQPELAAERATGAVSILNSKQKDAEKPCKQTEHTYSMFLIFMIPKNNA